jgi:hypothetical protein
MTQTPNAQRQMPNAAPRRGWINTYYRNYKGKKLGPYYVRRWKENGKLHKQHIKCQDVERVKAECQAHRERQLERRIVGSQCKALIDNHILLGKMYFGFEKGKEPNKLQAKYLVRLHHEGLYITGRPPYRRRIIRDYAVIGGKSVVIQTVSELDGTTKTFLVPFKIKRTKSLAGLWDSFFDGLKESIQETWESLHGSSDTKTCPPNQGLQPAF